ncbi:TAP-like protein-domain-containing protein [Phaeosphaeria sp. MPI-PUGE-AT-0046c]|nr:TAP-like protein-domain-containing protein [Phaeosphaeria sp. MPI-PUGE-AT-0046c]
MNLYAFLLALAAVSSNGAPLPAAPSIGQTISWTKCTDIFINNPRVECGNLTVPVDWAAPEGDTILLKMVRLPRTANSTMQHLGPLLVNPGGPGNSAIDMLRRIVQDFYPDISSKIFDSFDIIGVDPRGVGQSAAIDCDAAVWNERVTLFPRTREEYDKLVDKNKRLYQSCLARTGNLINHIDTLSTVKDLEAVRIALGEAVKLSWLGLSYGSQIGSQYAQLYPDNIRAMVLDGVLQHSGSDATRVLIEGTAYETALKEFFGWASKDEKSALKGQDVEKVWSSVLEAASKAPIPALRCGGSNATGGLGRCYKDVTLSEFVLNAQGGLINNAPYFRRSFAQSILSASQGDASGFSAALQPPSEIALNRDVFPGLAIACQDWKPVDESWEALQAKMMIGEAYTPLVKGASQTYSLQAACLGWGAPLANPPAPLKIDTKSPILLVNSIYDPSTSYVWAASMQEDIENSVLLTRNGPGHTTYGKGGKTMEAMEAFLLTAKLPEPGLAAAIRRKLKTLLDKKATIPGSTRAFNKTTMCKELGEIAQRHHAIDTTAGTRNDGPSVRALTAFLKKSGSMGGGDSESYYYGNMLLEKMRIWAGEKKTKAREKAEDE